VNFAWPICGGKPCGKEKYYSGKTLTGVSKCLKISCPLKTNDE
jgi:hypothetical protein